MGMAKPILFGAAYSVYVRIVRLVLEEKGVAYDLEEVDIFAAGGPPAAYRERHPFQRIPAFEHDGFRLYETGAISRYIDRAFPAPELQPRDLHRLARMDQIIAILDAYAYWPLVRQIFVERVRAPAQGRASDEAAIQAALPKARMSLAALEDLSRGEAYLAGPALSLADLHAAPMFVYFTKAAEAAALLADCPGLRGWWQRLQPRPSLAATRSPLE
jgi:glutathione S-transferase